MTGVLAADIVVSIAFIEENNMMPIVAGFEKNEKKAHSKVYKSNAITIARFMAFRMRA